MKLTKPEPKVVYSQRLPKELLQKVKVKAKKERVSIALIIENAFQEYLDVK